jgi:hypothetical protein
VHENGQKGWPAGYRGIGLAKPCYLTRGPKPYPIYNQVAMKILIPLLTFIFMRLDRDGMGGEERVLPFIHPEQRWVETGFNLLVLASSWVDVLL